MIGSSTDRAVGDSAEGGGSWDSGGGGEGAQGEEHIGVGDGTIQTQARRPEIGQCERHMR